MELENLQVKISIDNSQVKTGVKSTETELAKLEKSWSVINKEIESCFSSIKKLYGLNGSNNKLIDTTGISTAADGILDLKHSLQDLRVDPDLINDYVDIINSMNDTRDVIDSLEQDLSHAFGKEEENIKKEIQEYNGYLKQLSSYLKETEDKINLPLKGPSQQKGNNESSTNAGSLFKNLGMAILGFTGIFSLVRKLVSQNEKLTTAVNNIIGTIANVMAPVFNTLANIINFIANLISKIFKVNLGTKASSEATAKNTASFDEINNIDSNQNTSSAADSLATKWGDLSGLEKALTIIGGIAGLAGLIKTIQTIIELANKLGPLLQPIFTTVSSFFTSGAWKTIAGVGMIIGGIGLAIYETVDMFKNGWNIVGELLKDIGIIIAALGAIILGVPAGIAAVVAAIIAVITSLVVVIHEHWDEIVAWWNKFKQQFSYAWNKFWGDCIQYFKDKFEAIKQWFRDKWAAIKQWFSDTKQSWNNLVGALGTALKSEWQSIKDKFAAAKTWVKELFNSIGETIKAKFKSIVNNYIINPINKVVNWVNDKLHFNYSGLRILGKQVIPAFSTTLFHLNNIPQLATGTNYVASEGLAYLHQGEAVIPKKYNDNSGETNNLLRQLINVVDSKEFKAYISQKEIGKSAVDYINNQSRILGGSIV